MPKPDILIDPRVAEIYDLDAQIAVLKGLQTKLEAALIEEGEGTYVENDLPDARKVIVIVPSAWTVKYDLYSKDALKAFLSSRGAKKATKELATEFRALREAAAEALAGDKFKLLFDRVEARVPVASFDKIVPKMLVTAKGELSAKGRDLLLLCQVSTPPKKAHVKLPDKPKAEAEGDESED